LGKDDLLRVVFVTAVQLADQVRQREKAVRLGQQQQ
jgi:hypothetical protein